jgi:Ca2+-binding RTX toxin-like protein
MTLERLDSRITPSVTAVFIPNAGVLAVIGDAADNDITVSRNAAGELNVNGGAVAIRGGTATVANTARVQVLGLGGTDRLALDETNGALPTAHMFGGRGNDTLIGGASADLLFGEAGNDTLEGKGGSDQLFGGAGNDTFTGGDADDLAFGGAGDDTMVWNPGDDTDLNEGGTGVDTVVINGGNGDESFTTTANGSRVRFDRLDPAPFAVDIGTSEKLVLNANGGNDNFSATGNLAALIQISVDGGAGDDTLLGSNGVDLLIGGDGNDLIDGQQGNDTALMGAGDDVFQWDPGDGSDVIEGQAGADTLLFNGSGANEIFAIAPNGSSRVLFTRNVGTITMDMDDVELLNLNALGGADTMTVNDLYGTDIVNVNVNLAAVNGIGDAQPDTVIVNGTNGDDVVLLAGDATGVSVFGLAAQVNITGGETANDRVTINALAGDDTVEGAALAASAIPLTANGGDGDDVLIGGDGSDVLSGGNGDESCSEAWGSMSSTGGQGITS